MNINIEELANEMPEFNNHEEARGWFENRFQENIVFKERDIINDVPTYFYHIVKDTASYNNYMDMLSKDNEEIDSMTPFQSYTTVSISENGDVEISL